VKLVHRGEASKIVWIGDGPYRAKDSSVDAALRQKGHGVLSRDGNTAAAAVVVAIGVAIGVAIIVIVAVAGRREDNPKDRVDEIEAICLFQRGSVVNTIHSFRYDTRRRWKQTILIRIDRRYNNDSASYCLSLLGDVVQECIRRPNRVQLELELQILRNDNKGDV
jgi:hypothetical protein